MRIGLLKFKRKFMTGIALVFLAALLYPSLGFCILMVQTSPTYFLTVEKTVDQPTVIHQEGATELVVFTVKVNFNAVAPADGCFLTLNEGQCAVISDSQSGELGTICYEDIVVGSYQEFSYSATIGPYLDCGDFIIENTVTVADDSIQDIQCTDTVTVNVNVPCDQPGTGSAGYWKNHPEAWPVETITIGCVEYTKDDAIAYMKAPVKGDQTLKIFRALVAAKLNVLVGNDSSCIAATIAAADSWLCEKQLADRTKHKRKHWRIRTPFFRELNEYNNGNLCSPSRNEFDE